MDAICCQYRETWGVSETLGPRYKVQCCVLGWGGGGRTGQVRTLHSICTYRCVVCIDQSYDYDSFSVLSLIRERTPTIYIEIKNTWRHVAIYPVVWIHDFKDVYM